MYLKYTCMYISRCIIILYLCEARRVDSNLHPHSENEMHCMSRAPAQREGKMKYAETSE